MIEIALINTILTQITFRVTDEDCKFQVLSFYRFTHINLFLYNHCKI